MNKLLSLFILLLVSTASTAQENHYTFKPIQFQFSAPAGFTLVDSSKQDISFGGQAGRQLHQFLFRSGRNTLSFSFSTGTEGNTDWNTVYLKEANMFTEIMRAQRPTLKYEPKFSKIELNGQSFDKYSLIGREGDNVKYYHVDLSKHYKHYQVTISYTSEDEKTMKAVDEQLKSIKFL